MQSAKKNHNVELSCANVYPAFEKQGSPIVFESSGYFVPYLSIALQTIIDHVCPEENYDILILGDGITSVDQQRILRQAKGYKNISIRFIEPRIEVDRYINQARYHYITVNYYRMSLPWMLKNYKTAVNLGADILLLEDIIPLLKLEFEESEYLGGAMDLGYIGRLYEDIPWSELNLKKPFEYVNADVMIYHLEAIRRDFDQDMVMEFWQKYHFQCNEQDALNKLFDGHKKIIDLRWNTYPERMTSTKDILCTPPKCIAAWREALRNPALVHFAAVPKPWDYPPVCYGNDWWEIARQSVYYEEILRRMMQPVQHRIPSLLDMRDTIFPKGSRRRKFFKNIFVKPVRWGLDS